MSIKIPTQAEVDKQREESYRKSGDKYWEVANKILRQAREAQRQLEYIVPEWFRATEIPIVFAGTYHTPHIFMTCAVKFHTIVWDRDYGRGTSEMGWKAVDRPPLIVDVRIPINLASQDPATGIMFNGSGVMASQTMPHSHAGGTECFVGVAGETYLKTFKDYEMLRGRIANHLGGANLASLASHWGHWSEELKACFPKKLAKVIAEESMPGEDPNVIYGASKVTPDFTRDEIANDTWRDDDGQED
jgi:hypothetical protein